MNPDLDTDLETAYQVDPDTDMDPNSDTDTDPNPDPIRIQGVDDQKLNKKITADNFFNLFLIKNCN